MKSKFGSNFPAFRPFPPPFGSHNKHKEDNNLHPRRRTYSWHQYRIRRPWGHLSRGRRSASPRRIDLQPGNFSNKNRAGKCKFTAFRNHSLAVSALVIVSWVVKVLEAMMKRVVSGQSFFVISAMCVPSTLLQKWTLGPTW